MTTPLIPTGASRHRHRRWRLGVAGVTALIPLVAADHAAAKPVDQGHFHDVGTEVLDDFCGMNGVVNTFDFHGMFLGVASGRDGLVRYRDRSHGTSAFTNPVTGKSYTGVFASGNHDLQVTDNGDGTLTILIQGTGSEKWYDGNGKLVLRNPGNIRFEILIDHAGTPADPSDDVFLEDLGVVRDSTGRNDTEGRDFCEDFLLFTA